MSIIMDNMFISSFKELTILFTIFVIVLSILYLIKLLNTMFWILREYFLPFYKIDFI
jgi:hypothetical protein